MILFILNLFLTFSSFGSNVDISYYIRKDYHKEKLSIKDIEHFQNKVHSGKLKNPISYKKAILSDKNYRLYKKYEKLIKSAKDQVDLDELDRSVAEFIFEIKIQKNSPESGKEVVVFKSKRIILGKDRTCSIDLKDRLECWGENSDGQLGYGDERNRTYPSGDFVPVGSEPVLRVSIGLKHTCALFEKGVKCWGDNAHGQLGYGGSEDDMLSPPKNYIDLGNEKVLKIELGSFHTCALFENGGIKCWGYNYYGQLGYGDRIGRSTPPSEFISLGENQKAKDIALGHHSTCALLESDETTCWGNNESGQLGHGNYEHRLSPKIVLISSTPE